MVTRLFQERTNQPDGPLRRLARAVYHLVPIPLKRKRRILRCILPAPQEVARAPEHDPSMAVPFSYSMPSPGFRVAVVCHIFYDHLVPEIRRYLERIPGPVDVFISTDSLAKKTVIEAGFAGWRGAVTVRIAPNRGRDIAPKLITFRDIYPHYDIALFLHSKGSKHADSLQTWRGFLYETLLGSRDIVTSVLTAFAQRPDLGLIAAQHFEPIRHWIHWAGNFGRAAELAARMGLPSLRSTSVLDFPSGSMFWARTAALQPLFDLNLSFADFEPEQGQLDGTLAHAIERLFFHTAERAGLRWVKIADPALHAQTPAIKQIRAAADIDRFIVDHGLALTDAPQVELRSRGLDRVLPAAGLIRRLQDDAMGCDLAIDRTRRVWIGFVPGDTPGSQLRRAVQSAERALALAGLEREGRVAILDHGQEGLKSAPPTIVSHDEAEGSHTAGHNQLMRRAFAEGADVYIAASADGVFEWESVAALMQMVQAQNGRALIEARGLWDTAPRAVDITTLECAWATDACLVIPRSVFEAIGEFDELFDRFCGDVDLSWRARAAGLGVRTCPRAVFRSVDGGGLSGDRLQAMLQAVVLLARKWRNEAVAGIARRQLENLDLTLPAIDPAPVPTEWLHIADFEACLRVWRHCPSPLA